jgi:nitrite reductase (NADH) large subunit
MSERLVIVGLGMAAARLVDELTAKALGRYSIAVIGAEPRRAYNRVLLSSLLAGEVEEKDIELKPAAWWGKRGVTTVYGRKVARIDRKASCVVLDDGSTVDYDRLVLATGSDPIRLPLPGADLPGVLTFRDLTDIERIRGAMKAGARAVVIGGGLLGLEAAYGLAKAGVQTSVVHLMDRLMERQLDAEAGAMLGDAMNARGIGVHLNAQTKAITGDGKVEAVELGDGTVIPADLVIMSVGIRPQADLARAAGLNVNRGIVVDDAMTTSDPRIHALGECAEHRGIAYGLVEPAYEQARVLAGSLAGAGALYEGSITATNLKVYGIAVFSAGVFSGGETTQSIVLRDPGMKTYRKLVLSHERGVTRLVGCVLYGDTQDGLWYFDLIKRGVPVDAFRDVLAFGRMLTDQKAA